MTKQSELQIDTSLPFFAYGIYKPPKYKLNQINKIEELSLDNHDLIEKIVPLKIKSGKYYNNGYLIYFKEESSKKAYEFICDSEFKQYELKSKEIDGNKVNVLIKKQDKKFKHSPDPKLPFIAYGIFKPGQIAFSEISKYVKSIERVSLKNRLVIMDAMVLMTNHHSKGGNAYLIKFKDEKSAEKAYKSICRIEPKNVYDWKIIGEKPNQANVLMGIHPKMDNRLNKPIKNYDGLKDNFFKYMLESFDYENDINDFFKLQMNYLLLWAAIERFCVLKYAKYTKRKNNKKFSEEPKFKKYFDDNFKDYSNIDPEYTRSVFSPVKFRDIEFDPKNLEQTIEYYYSIRCNVTHRGKAFSENGIVLMALDELSTIFKEILKDTFNVVTIEGINFRLPYGFKEVDDKETDEYITKTFKKDDKISIDGIPECEIKISVRENNESDDKKSIFEEDTYKFVKNGKLIEIKVDEGNILDIIEELLID